MNAHHHCFITGTGRGLGRELALRFWDSRYNLTLLGRSYDALEETKCLLPPHAGQNVVVVVADLSSANMLDSFMEESWRQNGSIDVLINNAGIQGPIGKLETTDKDKWEETLRVNLLSPVALCRLVVPEMLHKKWGRIINLSGGGASGARPNFSAYATAKAGLIRFSECLAHELEGSGVTVNCVAPGAMKTGMLEEIIARGEIDAGVKEFTLAQNVLAKNESTMEKAAELCLFLASPASSFNLNGTSASITPGIRSCNARFSAFTARS